MAIHAVRIMSADDYRKLQAQDAIVADLRLPLDYLQGHLEGAVSLPGTRYHLRYQLAEIGTERPLILIAQAPVDIDPFIHEAEAAGAQVTGILTGAPRGWQARGLPVLAWSAVVPAALGEWAGPTPALVDLGEPEEESPAEWPNPRRLPLSGWTRETVEELAQGPTILLGATARLRYAAIRLFEGGARHVYFGQTTRSSTGSAPVH
jgi:rhodanese-related sulfurtransferase